MTQMRKAFVCLLFACSASLAGKPGCADIREVQTQPLILDLSLRDLVHVRYCLGSSTKVRICAYDPENALARCVVNWEPRNAGTCEDFWDGRTDDGKIVPDESYYFTIEAKNDAGEISVYDPLVTSGGDEIELSDIGYDPAKGVVSFRLEQPSRVLLRAGIRGGPLM